LTCHAEAGTMGVMKLGFAAAAAWGAVLCFSNGCGDDGPGPEGGTERDAAVDHAGTDAGGGNPSDAALPPLDPDALMTSLTEAQLRLFCDWKNATLGGYALTFNCGAGSTVSTDDNQEKCLAFGLVTRCPITVRQYENCILAMAPSHSCVFPNDQCHYLVCQ
jgi:hypothetical protein